MVGSICPGLRIALTGAVCSVLAASPVVAQTAPVADPSAIFTLLGENSSLSTQHLTDRYYTNGLGASYLSGEGQFEVLGRLTQPILGDGAPRLALSISQQIYTPADTEARLPPPGDRPYAGLLLGNIGLTQDGADMRTSLALSLGMVGPFAAGKTVQNGWHDLIGQRANNGWNTQLHDEAVFAFTGGRVWRRALGTVGGFEVDALPAFGISLGTLRTAAQGGVTVRLGQGLAYDFGAPRIRALSGGEAFHGGDTIGWYLFAGIKGDAVGQDITLNGNDFRNSRSVKPTTLVGEADLGAAIVTNQFRVSYTHVLQTQEFAHQKGGLHQLGALTLSVRF